MIAGACALAVNVLRSPADSLDDFPRQVVWAWERPEDVSFLDPRTTGVAYWAGTVFLSGGKTIFQPRFQPFKVAPATRLIAVIRIDSDHGDPPQLNDAQMRSVMELALQAVNRPEIQVLQIDFDAKVSERGFYRELLHTLRMALPASKKLSMTVLPSWCLADDWTRDLTVDERVPMLFNLGPDEKPVAFALADPTRWANDCHQSAGIWQGKTVVSGSGFHRLYFFQSHPWTEAEYAIAQKENSQWFD